MAGDRRLRALWCALLLGASACSGSGGDGTGPTGPSGNAIAPNTANVAGLNALVGTWSGEWQSMSGDGARGTLSMTWQRVGRVVRGPATVTGTPCVSASEATGLLNGTAIDFVVGNAQAEMHFSGAVGDRTMSGAYTLTCGNESGSWTATKA